MSTRDPRRSRLRPATAPLLLLVLLGGLLTGCVSLPDSGPVRHSAGEQQVEEDAPVDYEPPGPQAGSTRTAVVRGFLDAMLAAPLKTFVARQFLTSESSNEWVPESSTVIFGEEDITQVRGAVRLRLAQTKQLDGRGGWSGDPTHGEGITYRLKLVREKGEWRITNPPDALIIPLAHFESRYQQYFLYFFDPSAQILVPEPVYVPRGEQAATLLVSGLLKGPARKLMHVERTFIPPRTRYEISVPVSGNGVAEVPLNDEILKLDDATLNLAVAQLAWTLGQLPAVERTQITVDGSPLDLAGPGRAAPASRWSSYDPAVDWASNELFGVRDGHVVTLLNGKEVRVSGAFGSLDLRPRWIAVDLAGEQIAGVSSDRHSVLLAPRARAGDAAPTGDDVTVVADGKQHLVKPAWDVHGDLWLLDRTGSGAVVSVVAAGKERRIEVPGVNGRDVGGFVVSRDGTRFVAVVRGGHGDRLVSARIARDVKGRVREVTRARTLPIGTDLEVSGRRQIRDVAWNTAGSLAVLTAAGGGGSTQALVAKVDGSSTVVDGTSSLEGFGPQAVRVVTSPTMSAEVYLATTTGQLYLLASNGRWVGTSVAPGLRSATYVG